MRPILQKPSRTTQASVSILSDKGSLLDRIYPVVDTRPCRSCRLQLQRLAILRRAGIRLLVIRRIGNNSLGDEDRAYHGVLGTPLMMHDIGSHAALMDSAGEAVPLKSPTLMCAFNEREKAIQAIHEVLLTAYPYHAGPSPIAT